jgi:hypothetical protein
LLAAIVGDPTKSKDEQVKYLLARRVYRAVDGGKEQGGERERVYSL